MFENILRVTGNTEIHFEIKNEGYTVRLRNINSGLGKSSVLTPHSEEFYSELEKYIEVSQGAIYRHLSDKNDIVLIESKNIPEKRIRVACTPSMPLNSGCTILIRFK